MWCGGQGAFSELTNTIMDAKHALAALLLLCCRAAMPGAEAKAEAGGQPGAEAKAGTGGKAGAEEVARAEAERKQALVSPLTFLSYLSNLPAEQAYVIIPAGLPEFWIGAEHLRILNELAESKLPCPTVICSNSSRLASDRSTVGEVARYFILSHVCNRGRPFGLGLHEVTPTELKVGDEWRAGHLRQGGAIGRIR